jgi:hypothetical protein
MESRKHVLDEMASKIRSKRNKGKSRDSQEIEEVVIEDEVFRIFTPDLLQRNDIIQDLHYNSLYFILTIVESTQEIPFDCLYTIS